MLATVNIKLMMRTLSRSATFFFSPFSLTFCVLVWGGASLHLVCLHLQPDPGVEDKHDGEGNEEVEDGRGYCEVKRGLVHPLGVEGHGAPGRFLQILALELDIIHLKRKELNYRFCLDPLQQISKSSATLAKMDQGYAETTLVTQMRTIILRALPTPVREFRVRGWQIAWYLQEIVFR